MKKLELTEKILRRLKDEEVAWLTTVNPSNVPQPAPIWFLWEDESLLIYSHGKALRNRNIEHNDRVSFNLNSNEQGGDIVVVWGRATIETETPAADQHSIYLDKYREGIARIGMTPESFAQTYSVVIRVRPTQLKSF